MKLRALLSLCAGALLGAGCAGHADLADEDTDVAAAPIVNTGHPRLWLTAADVTRLRGWAGPQNPMYVNGLAVAQAQAIATYDTQFFPGGQPNAVWPDPGTDGTVYYTTEAYAEFFAFLSLIDQDPTARATHAARARSLLMHVMNEAAKGQDPSANPAPFRSPTFATYNRANYWSEAFGLTVDWIYPALSTADKATIRKVFLRWAGECSSASTYPMTPQPAGMRNDTHLVTGTNRLRWAANNYYAGHARHLALMALALDPADDPLVNASLPTTAPGNSLRAYLADVTGAWLYQQYAVYEDAATVSAAYGVPAAGLGAASGGLPVEGFLYGESLGYLGQTLLALRTAGYDDPTLQGPQVGLGKSPFWDRFLTGWLSSLAPAAQVPSAPGYAYLGPVYQMAGYGDMLRAWISADLAPPLLTLGALDQANGDTHRISALRWAAANAVEGGAGQLTTRVAKPWGNADATRSILYFMLFDPAAAIPADPRPALPTLFTDKPSGRVLARTDWSPQASWFTYRCSWETINHQLGDCNQFELYRNGEWLAKERSGYANDGVGATSDYHDTLSVQNDKPATLQWFETESWARGGQWTNGASAGDPVVTQSAGAGYVYAGADATNLYNYSGGYSPSNGAWDVTHVSRGVVWLPPDHVVVYDRATSKTDQRFKRFNLTVTGQPTIAGAMATVATPGGQQLFVRKLLPAAAVLTALPAENFNLVATLEPTRFRLVSQDPAGPKDVRFLHVLQGADAGAAADPAVAFKTLSGTPCDGAIVNGTAVLFPVSVTAPFTAATYQVPSSVAAHLVTGLAPGAGYTVSVQSAGAGSTQITVTPGGTSKSDAAGVLKILTGAATLECTPTSTTMPAAGGPGSVTVSSLGNAPWTTASASSWLSVGPGGAGAGSASYVATPNLASSPRTGTLLVAGRTITITQAGAQSMPTAGSTPPPPGPAPACSYVVSLPSYNLSAAGGTRPITVSVASGCAWTTTSTASWLSAGSSGSGTGCGTITASVAPNTTGAQRTATLTVGGKVVTFIQSATSGS
jgi:hypothetical protein